MVSDPIYSQDFRLDLGQVNILFRCHLDESFLRTREFRKPEFGDDYVFLVADILLFRAGGQLSQLFKAEEIGNVTLLLADFAESILRPKLVLPSLGVSPGKLGMLHEELFDRYVGGTCTNEENLAIDSLATYFVASGDRASISVYEISGKEFIEVTYPMDKSVSKVNSVYQQVDSPRDAAHSVRQKKTEMAAVVNTLH